MKSEITDLARLLEKSIAAKARNHQTVIGPSEMGGECMRCLALRLAGVKTSDPIPPWLPWLGTLVHEWIDDVLTADRGAHGFYPGKRVHVGRVGPDEIYGELDCFHQPTGTVIDFKVAGSTTLKSAKAQGPKLAYVNQAQLYGLGLSNAGYPVQAVCIWFINRNGFTLRDGYVWSIPYDEQVALAVLRRANKLRARIEREGLAGVLAGHCAHAGTEFGCSKEPPTTEQSFAALLKGA